MAPLSALLIILFDNTIKLQALPGWMFAGDQILETIMSSNTQKQDLVYKVWKWPLLYNKNKAKLELIQYESFLMQRNVSTSVLHLFAQCGCYICGGVC